MRYSEQALRSAAVACYENTAELRASAEILYRANQLEHALALGCVGMEEFGKAFLYTLAALRPDQRDRIGDKLGGHHAKRWAFTQIGKTVTSLRQTTPGFTIADYFVCLAESGLDDFLLSNQTAPEQSRRLNEGALFPAELKDAALYVDLVADGTLRLPRKASRAFVFAQMHIRLLSGHLRQFAALPDLLTDESEWESFAASVRYRIHGAGS